MQHISKTTGLPPPEIVSPSERDECRAANVWIELGETFGERFYQLFGREPAPRWVAAIALLSDAEIVNGLANLGRDGREHPANLSVFVAACKRRPPHRHLGVPLLPLSDEQRQREADKAWDDMERLAGRTLRPESDRP